MGHEDKTRAALLVRAAEQGRLAPSVHNTQPWRFVLEDDAVQLHADPVRRLRVLDPSGRQLVVSCGCALMNVRVALAADAAADVQRFPDPANPELVARVALRPGPGDPDLARLSPEIERRRANRRAFGPGDPPPEVLERLELVALQEGAALVRVEGSTRRRRVAELCREADAAQSADPAYREELRRWTTDELDRLDGVPAMATPQTDSQRRGALPVRDFDQSHHHGWLPPVAPGEDTCMVVLTTSADDPHAWLRAGEALERVWLEATSAGLAVGLHTQVAEVPDSREQLREVLGRGHPHVVLRLGHAATTPATPRRKATVVVQRPEDLIPAPPAPGTGTWGTGAAPASAVPGQVGEDERAAP